jgi:hypothetical protein
MKSKELRIMKTDAKEYVALLKEIQNSTSSTFTSLPTNEPRFIIDSNSREISIPPEFSFLGVQDDHKAETIYFEIDRYFDNEDLSKHTCVVQFINKDSEGINEGIYPVAEMDLDSTEGKIVFGWEISNNATQKVGEIAFSVRFYSINDDGYFSYNFNTLPSVSNILKGLSVIHNEENIFPSEMEIWISKIETFSDEVKVAQAQAISASQNAATSAAYAEDQAVASATYAEQSYSYAERLQETVKSVSVLSESAQESADRAGASAVRAESAATLAEDAAERAETAVFGGDLTDYVKKTDLAELGGEAGLIKLATLDVGNGLTLYNGCLSVIGAHPGLVGLKTSNRQALTPKLVDDVVKAGLINNVYSLTDEEKASARSWLGASCVETGSYVGIGTANYTTPTVLNFNSNPQILFLYGEREFVIFHRGYNYGFGLQVSEDLSGNKIKPTVKVFSACWVYGTWGEKTFSFKNIFENGNVLSSGTYNYLAI